MEPLLKFTGVDGQLIFTVFTDKSIVWEEGRGIEDVQKFAARQTAPKQEMYIPAPPREAFWKGSMGSMIGQTVSEGQHTFMIEMVSDGNGGVKPRIEYPESGGIFRYFQGMKFPEKGFPTPEAITACNIVKRALVTVVKSFTSKWLILSYVGLLFTPWRFKLRIGQNLLNNFLEFCRVPMRPVRWDDRYFMLPVKELRSYIDRFIDNLGLSPYDEENQDSLGLYVGMMIEFDSAYSYRFQDIMSEVDKEALISDPSREFARLLDIFAQREPQRPHLVKKFALIIKALRILFLSPRIRRAFVAATQGVDFENLGLSEADKYHVLYLNGYEFMGRTIEDRVQEWLDIHDGHPPEPLMLRGT